MCVGDCWSVSHYISSPQPSARVASTGNPQAGRAREGVGQVASRGRKGLAVPATGCAVRPPPQPPGTSLGPAKFTGELLPRGRIKLPLGV